MSNSIEAYKERIAGLSPNSIKDEVVKFSSSEWKGVALDVGTGRGGWARYLKDSKCFERIIGLDILDSRDEDMRDLEFNLVNIATKELPFADSSIDWIFAIEVLEHLENPRFFMREAFRVLKPNGHFVMSTPSCDSLTSKISFFLRGYFPPFCQHDYKGSGHITPITNIDFQRMSNEAGFHKTHRYFTLPGRIPSVKLTWQRFFPFLQGILWSDSFIAKCDKNIQP